MRPPHFGWTNQGESAYQRPWVSFSSVAKRKFRQVWRFDSSWRFLCFFFYLFKERKVESCRLYAGWVDSCEKITLSVELCRTSLLSINLHLRREPEANRSTLHVSSQGQAGVWGCLIRRKIWGFIALFAICRAFYMSFWESEARYRSSERSLMPLQWRTDMCSCISKPCQG
jgi:hypothetical protein